MFTTVNEKIYLIYSNKRHPLTYILLIWDSHIENGGIEIVSGSCVTFEWNYVVLQKHRTVVLYHNDDTSHACCTVAATVNCYLYNLSTLISNA